MLSAIGQAGPRDRQGEPGATFLNSGGMIDWVERKFSVKLPWSSLAFVGAYGFLPFSLREPRKM
jgi:hypothetical protein